MIECKTELQKTVIQNGYCVGCGACAAVEDSPYRMCLNQIGQYEAVLMNSDNISSIQEMTDRVCPFGASCLNEDQIGSELYSQQCQHHPSVGYYYKSFAGYVKESHFRELGSSGGFGTWILHELFRAKKVDFIINVQSRQTSDFAGKDGLFQYTICRSIDEIQKGAKSRYYPIELSDVMKLVRRQPGRYAIIGLPCFIKSVRLLQNVDRVLADRIHFCIGLVCGHLKSAHYADSLAWQAGIDPNSLNRVDFRVKNTQAAANKYFTAVSSHKVDKIIPTSQLFGTDWGMGAFKYKSCDFCDDVFAETADMVLGDAWLPKYVQDGEGTNILVIRNKEIYNLIEAAWKEERLQLEELQISQVIASQDAGLRHRKIALGYRLEIEQNKGNWVPNKRVSVGGEALSEYEKKRQQLRNQLRDTSQYSFRKALDINDLSIYIDAMSPIYTEYNGIKGSYWERLNKFLKRVKGYLQRKLMK